MKHFTLSFLGAFQAKMGDTPFTNFRSAKIQGLLIYLVLSPQQAHDRDVLTALFWPDEPEPVAKQNFRQSLYRLRKLLGDIDSPLPPYLLIERTTVQFNAATEHSLDVADFLSSLEKEQLERAVSLYQGELLPSFSCDSQPFDEWLRHERERLHRLALDTLFKLTAQRLTQADYQSAQDLARQQLTLEPWREEAHQQLIQALALQGERSAAIAQYESCRAILAEELGIEPSAETKNYLAHIHNHPAKHPATQTSAAQASKSPAQHLSIPFVGRKTEYAALVAAYQRASSNGGLQLVTLAGNAGIGKTRLTEQFLAWATLQGADVLQSRAFETSGGLSYQPITHLLRQRLERENAPEDLLSDLWLSQLTRLLPELRDRYPDLPEPTQEENTARQHLFEAITRLLLALAARQPLLISIDDWHWADSASLDVLHYAAVRWAEAGVPILLLLGLRQEAVNESAAMQSWLRRLNHSVSVMPVQLSELSQMETAQLMQTVLEFDDNGRLRQFSDWLFAETAGQPLFLTETLKALVADGLIQLNRTTARWQLDGAQFAVAMKGGNGHFGRRSAGRIAPGIQQIIKGWLGRITPPANKLLTAAAVLTQNRTFDQLCAVAGLEEGEALTALDDLLSKQLLLEGQAGSPMGKDEPIYNFSHQKVSEVVYAEAGAARRRVLHRQAFALLGENARPALVKGAVSAADLAYHARNAGLLAETIHYSLVAGNEAMALFAFGVAITHFEMAHQLAEQSGWPETISGADREALYSSLGRAYEITAEWSKAQKTYEAMIAEAQTVGATAMACLGLNRLAAIYLYHQIDGVKAADLLDQAQRMAEQSGDKRGLAETEMNLALFSRTYEGPQRSLDHSARAMTLARELGHPKLLAGCVSLRSYVSMEVRQWEAAEAYGIESRQLYSAVGNLVLAADSQRAIGAAQMHLGKPRESLATLQETMRFSQQIENLWGQADCGWKLALTHLELGHYGEAIRLANQAVVQTHSVGHPPLILWASLALGTVQRTTMQLAAAQETQQAVFGETPKIKGFLIYPEWALAELCAQQALAGAWEQACTYAMQILQLPLDDAMLPYTFTGWYETEALLHSGEGELARAEEMRRGLVVGNNRRYRLPLLRSQAVLAQWDGDVGQAIIHLQAALALAQEMSLPGEEWPILGELGRLYAARGDQDRAQQAYKAAAMIIHRLAETIDAEALRVGYLTSVPVRSVLGHSK